ncbi:MAG TPA: hypothetical protein VFX98_05915 [Longimicrobiaceae bacterium]|nr:hypothetical protein [Longimicrobiaceae bacterium]
MGASVEAIRHAAEEAVNAGSLRSVAASVGMSPTGLRQFLNGRTPYRATLRKLADWYLHYQLGRHEFSAETARAGMFVLLEAVPEAHQAHARERLLDRLAEIHRDLRLRPPSWLARLRGSG